MHVNTLPYHQRELALLTDELLRLNNENKSHLIQEIELAHVMIENERELERKRKRKALTFIEGMEKAPEEDQTGREMNTGFLPVSVKPTSNRGM